MPPPASDPGFHPAKHAAYGETGRRSFRKFAAAFLEYFAWTGKSPIIWNFWAMDRLGPRRRG